MAISDILEIGRQGLMASRTALQTSSNNIANATTPGYCRQKPMLLNRQQIHTGSTITGGGVYVHQILREHNSFVQNQITEESCAFGAAKTKVDALRRLEGIVNSDGHNVNDLMNRFFNDVRELSANPETSVNRSAVASSADTLSYAFRNLNTSLDNLKRDLDEKLVFTVNEVNLLTKELAQLNGHLSHASSVGKAPNELYDRRDQVVRELAEKLGFQAISDDHEHVNINVAKLGILVQGTESKELVVERTPQKGNKTAGSLDVSVREPNQKLRVVTQAFTQGEIGGIISVRDNVVNPALSHLDLTAYEFVTHVNEAHEQGVGMDGKTGRGLFKDLKGPVHASEFIDLNDEIKQTHEKIAAGYSDDTPGDNRVALNIAAIQEMKILPNALNRLGSDRGFDERTEQKINHSVNESLNAIVGRIALQGRDADDLYRRQENLLTQLDNYRQSVSGVSLDEEAVNLMQYQALYNASAKMMKLGDELLDTVLSIKR